MQKLFKSDRLLPSMFGKTSLEIFIQDVMEPTLILKYSFENITCQRVKLNRLQERSKIYATKRHIFYRLTYIRSCLSWQVSVYV